MAMEGEGAAPPEAKKEHPKRKMKTPSQLEILERVYAEDKYPSEVVRAELSQKLNLTDRQLQMWFCHRRLKDRKGDDGNPAAPPSAPKKTKKEKAAVKKDGGGISPADATRIIGEVGMEPSVTPPKPAKSSKKKNQQHQQVVLSEQQQIQNAELAAIRLVEEQLGEPLREDGPALGCEFDPLPPGAFDTPIEHTEQRMFPVEAPSKNEFSPMLGPRQAPAGRIHQFIPEHPTSTSIKGKAQQSASSSPLLDAKVPSLSLNFFPTSDADIDEPPNFRLDMEKPALPEPPSINRKRKSEDAKLAKELEAQEKKLKKEAEKQEAARRKREEQERKEIEKMNRERQKEIEKINRERQREEERQQREHKKEQERLERLAQKEQQRLEKLRVKEELRRQKEQAKMQAAYERATAKKLAKLSTGLIEDEQLELMQMGAFVQGLVSGDMEGIDRSKVELKKYPPASVRMKRVLGIPPWDSDQNVSNLLVVWRFLTTFSDALGLWPFTVDELVQGLHDFDSRLLNEIYMALLKTLIKDVEDAAQAAASGNAGSQHAISVAAGGHPQIVEAAYTWGFDIQEWGQHMNPLTWPEILRQFALAAGYGPRWKKRSVPEPRTDYIEVNDGHNANAIATLRSGAAAVNAVALMRGKHAGRVKLKKGQAPKLTPGTVKYAAFHVLSIEGNKGLTIMELTDRIQKSGLRDLSSSKTPEASISAALSRDTILFERVAPSTYCVRAEFRRDTDEPEDVLQAALERTYLYQTRQIDPDKVDEDALEYAEESTDEEHDSHEDQDMHEHEEHEHETPALNTGTPPPKVILRLKTGKAQEKEAVTADGSPPEKEVKTESIDEPKQQESRPTSSEKNHNNHVDDDDMEIDESQVGEPWVQGLMEGEFSDLSIEERLNALVALVDILNEGNTIRSVLEERYECASALKRQLWEEVQVDKRRLKEEQTKSVKLDIQDDDYDNIASTSAACSAADKPRAQMKAEIRLRAEKLYVIRSLPLGLDRRYNRYWQFAASTAGEDPGCARIYFECNEDGHWEVIDTEEALDALMGCLDTRGMREAALYSILTHIAGPLRKAMKSLAQFRASDPCRSEGSPSSGVCGPSDSVSDVSSAISVELRRNKLEIQHAVERFKDLDNWTWNRCMRKSGKTLKALSMEKKRDVETLVSCELCHGIFWPTENHCTTCHLVIEESKFAQHVQECENSTPLQLFPSRLQLLKHLLLAVEVAVPANAFKSSWTDTRKNWCNNVKDASSPGELLQAFTDLESAIDEQWISSTYETTEKALSSTAAFGQSKNLPWIPQTTAAIGVRLYDFDAAIAYHVENKEQFQEKTRAQQTNVTGNVQSRGSSPDSDLPPDFQNGHARQANHKHQQEQQQQQQDEQHEEHMQKHKPEEQQQEKPKARLCFRLPGRIISGEDGQKQRSVNPPPEDESSDDESEDTEHSYDEQQHEEHNYYEQGRQEIQQQGQIQQQQEQNYQQEGDYRENYGQQGEKYGQQGEKYGQQGDYRHENDEEYEEYEMEYEGGEQETQGAVDEEIEEVEEDLSDDED